MNSKYEVMMMNEFGKPVFSVTQDGCQWSNIRIEDPLTEIPKMINVLTTYLLQLMDLNVNKAEELEVASLLLSAAIKSGNEGSIRLAAQLAGVQPCDECGFV